MNNDNLRSYCYKCKAKKMRKYMITVSISANNRYKWKCIDCSDENRMFGHNATHGNDYSRLTKNNVLLDKYKRIG